MPSRKRIKTDYPGVYYIIGKAITTKKPERIYYIRYRKDGKSFDEKAGRQFQNDMTPARAARIRALRIEGKELSNTEHREAERAAKKAENDRWTIAKLWDVYKKAKPNLKGWKKGTYDSLYNKHIAPNFANKEPIDILPLDVKRIENRLLKTHSPQLTKHVLKQIRTLCNFGRKNNLCPGLSFTIEMPLVDNIKTEDLSQEQIDRLLKAIDSDDHPQAGAMMKVALFTGMRRGEMFRLKWNDLDFEKGFVHLRNTKSGKDQKIPMNDTARELFEGHREKAEKRQNEKKPPKWSFSEYVFPGRAGEQRTRIDRAVNVIKKAAKLPKGFRGLHGLRHTYASALASSGKVDLYTLQKLLTHADPATTMRYSHLRDRALRQASDVANDIFTPMQKKEDKKTAYQT